MRTFRLLLLALLSVHPCLGNGQTLAANPYPEWSHTGAMHILTTPEGANLPASASVEGFPLLVRLHQDFFDFNQAKPKGEDIRFSSATGQPLPYQIEQWGDGQACIWVRIPVIRGDSSQQIHLHWGKADAPGASDGAAVFNETNGYLSVWHMDGTVKDSVGTLDSKDTGTSSTTGVIGGARSFPGQAGIFCGDKITGYPAGSAPHSSEAWFRAKQPNARVLAWGNEHGQGKVVMHYRSPPHVKMECYFSGADVEGETRIPTDEWAHVIHTYQKGESRLYVNGVLAGKSITASAPLAIKNPARMWIGGWYHNYDFVGDIDEVRISSVTRSEEWIRLQFENQKPFQTLHGLVVRPGNDFSLSHQKLVVDEGSSTKVTAKADGARKIYWLLKNAGQEKVVATDRLSFTFAAGRVMADTSTTLICRAVYADAIQNREVPITIREKIPEPVFTLEAPERWDGRQTIEIIPRISNLAAMEAQGAGKLVYRWSVSGLAVTKETAPGKLVLKRGHNSGPMTVRVAIGNGGAKTEQATTIIVREPANDAWERRVPGKNEKPEDFQFIPRDDQNEGTLFHTGVLAGPADTVFARLYADGKLVDTVTQKPADDLSYSLALKLKAGMIRYKIEFGSKANGIETVSHTASDVVCGDAYLIDGQSNAEATDVGRDDPAFTSEWIRSYGSMGGNPEGARLKSWAKAVVRDRNGGKAQIGYWGMELARHLVDSPKMPICIINGAVGGSRIDQHQRDLVEPADVSTIYGRLLWRVQQARLTHGIRGVLWHQGENDQGADGPTGGYGFETYQQYFIDMAAGWKKDYPNLQHQHIFQIWPKSCSMGVKGSDNRLREVQRNLQNQFSNLSVMSTLGVKPPGGCHFPIAGYAEFARLIHPLLERHHYGKVFEMPVTPANLKGAAFTTSGQDEIVLEFDQPVRWDNTLIGQFQLDGKKGQVVSGVVSGKSLRLKLAGPSRAGLITYLDSAAWSQDHLLQGENGIAALTFCEVPIRTGQPSP